VVDKTHASYAFGWSLGTDLQSSGEPVDIATVIRGLQDAYAKKTPAYTEQQLGTAYSGFQQRVQQKMEAQFRKALEDNKAQSAAFVTQYKTQEGVVTLPSGIMYRIAKPGTGPKATASSQVQIGFRSFLAAVGVPLASLDQASVDARGSTPYFATTESGDQLFVKVLGQDVEKASDVDWLFWVGCAGAYEDRAKQTTRAVAELLDTAGVSFAVLGNGETCTGDSARRAGNELLFQTLAQQNVNTFGEFGVVVVLHRLECRDQNICQAAEVVENQGRTRAGGGGDVGHARALGLLSRPARLPGRSHGRHRRGVRQTSAEYPANPLRSSWQGAGSQARPLVCGG